MTQTSESEQITKRSINTDTVQTVLIVVALLFTTYQVFENTNALEQQEIGNILSQQQDLFNIQLENSETYVKSLYCPDRLTPPDVWKMVEIIYMRLDLLGRFYEASENGVVNDVAFVDDEFRYTPFYLGTPVGREIWKRARPEYGEDSKFVQRIDAELASPSEGIHPDHVYFRDLVQSVTGKALDVDTICGA